MMQANNAALKGQGDKIDELFEYNQEISAYIEKANGHIYKVEQQVFIKKALLLSIIAALGLMIIVVLLLKLIN